MVDSRSAAVEDFFPPVECTVWLCEHGCPQTARLTGTGGAVTQMHVQIERARDVTADYERSDDIIWRQK